MTTVNASTASLTLTTHSAEVAEASPFEFPVIDGYSGAWNIDPLDKIDFYQARTTTRQSVYNDAGVKHANPVQVNRYGTLPALYTDNADYSVWVRNRFGVVKYQITSISGAWTVGTGFVEVEAKTAAISLDTFPATVTTTTRVNVNTATLTLTTFAASIDLEATSTGYVAYTPPAVEDFDYSAYGSYTPPAVEDFDYS